MSYKTKIIYTKWLAEQLEDQGFRIIGSKPNPNYPELYCWIFKDTEALNLTLTSITLRNKQKQNKC